jgi:hypothetical protein
LKMLHQEVSSFIAALSQAICASQFSDASA